jgi:hypothetical protein
VKKLTPQREIFAAEIAKGSTQAAAYLAAYPRARAWKDTTLWPTASRLAAEPAVVARIADLRTKASRALDVSVERVLAERARQAFINPADLVGEDGKPLGLKQLPEDVARGLAGVKFGKDGVEYRLAKDSSLTALERHLGMYANDDNGGRRAGVINIQINLGEGESAPAHPGVPLPQPPAPTPLPSPLSAGFRGSPFTYDFNED